MRTVKRRPDPKGLIYAFITPRFGGVTEKRSRPSDNPPELPPGRNLGVGNASCGGHADGDPLSKIVAAGARKEKLRVREWAKASRSVKPRQRYAELRCASAFSFLDGASLPED